MKLLAHRCCAASRNPAEGCSSRVLVEEWDDSGMFIPTPVYALPIRGSCTSSCFNPSYLMYSRAHRSLSLAIWADDIGEHAVRLDCVRKCFSIAEGLQPMASSNPIEKSLALVLPTLLRGGFPNFLLARRRTANTSGSSVACHITTREATCEESSD